VKKRNIEILKDDSSPSSGVFYMELPEAGEFTDEEPDSENDVSDYDDDFDCVDASQRRSGSQNKEASENDPLGSSITAIVLFLDNNSDI
jgi:hypothetical protein